MSVEFNSVRIEIEFVWLEKKNTKMYSMDDGEKDIEWYAKGSTRPYLLWHTLGLLPTLL